jgi:hypothetical protein
MKANNIKMDLTEMEWEVMDECIRLRIRTSERLL